MATGDVSTKMEVPSLTRTSSLPTKDVPEYLHKVLNDPVHGHIKLHTQLMDFIDTPIFQRLRSIRQLGGTYHVFPGASHNRFEHSIGMCYLAGELLKSIRSQQSTEQEIMEIIDINNILSVQIAALCYNIGYGPFSKVYHEMFLPLVKGKGAPKLKETSCMMFQYLVTYLKENEILKEGDVNEQFIQDLMCGDFQAQANDPPMENFLYQVVCNKTTGIDVALFDSLARDCQHVHINTPFDHSRLIKFTRVIGVINGHNDPRAQLCFRDKEIGNLYDMFHAQEIIRRRAYQHKTVVSIEQMIAEAFLAADDADEIRIQGTDGVARKLSDCVNDPVAFEKLDDTIFNTILHTEGTSPGLKKAKELLRRIQTRDLYKYVGSVKPKKANGYKKNENDICKDISAETGGFMDSKDFFVKVIKFDYMEDGKDPVEEVRFFTKRKPDVARQITKEQVSHILPDVFRDMSIMVFIKDKKNIDYARNGMRKWCKRNSSLIVPHDMEDDASQPADASK